MAAYHLPDLPETEAALLRLGDEVTLCHYRLNTVLEVLHQGEPLAPSLRGVMRNLMAHGPMTVPDIAALRPVSRQFVQRIVDTLRAKGWVELLANPAHKRSHLVQLTEKGRVQLTAMYGLEAKALRRALDRTGAKLRDIEQTTALLQQFRSAIDSELAHHLGKAV